MIKNNKMTFYQKRKKLLNNLFKKIKKNNFILINLDNILLFKIRFPKKKLNFKIKQNKKMKYLREKLEI